MRHILLLILALPLVARADFSDQLIVSPDADLKPELVVNQVQMRSDLDVLLRAAAAAYAGPDLANVLQTYGATLPLFSTPQAFCHDLQVRLADVRDSHLRADLIDQSCGVAREGGHVGANLRARPDTWGTLRQRAESGRDVDVIAIPEFLNADDPSWDGFESKLREVKARALPFVLDLRGNPGGDSQMAATLARVLYGLDANEALPDPTEARLSRITLEAFALQANAWAIDEIQARGKGQLPPPYCEDERGKTLRWMQNAKSGRFPPTSRYEFPSADLRGKDVFPASVYVLIDGECGSSCEMALQYLEALPHRVLVGEKTMGAVNYGEISLMVLPQTRVIVTLATTSTRYRDYRDVEKIGYAPTVPVPAGQDALTAVLELVE